MRNTTFLGCLAACSIGIFAAACGDDEDDMSGDKGPAAGSGSEMFEKVNNPDEINPDCPSGDVGPLTGEYGPKGKCCYRTSNKARIDKSADERTLEYRLNEFLLINHQKTIDLAILGPVTIARFDNEEQSILFRFRMPQENGKVKKGTGHITLGTGRYNCDGTYSFYSETAAPTDTGTRAPDRWSVPEFEAPVDPDKTDQTMIRPTYKQSLALKNRPGSLPYLDGNYQLDWEGSSQGFDIIKMPTGDENLDCVGSRKESKWVAGGKTIAYGRLDTNNTDKIDQLGVNFCQLMAFGRAEGAANHDCEKAERCEPGSKDCPWQRLPDSLCPVTDDERKSWGCHLGWGGNKDNEDVKLNCTNDAPKDIDPDNGTSEGQCCDPYGKSKDLPACNAWLQINEFVAAAARITKARADTLQESCHGRGL